MNSSGDLGSNRDYEKVEAIAAVLQLVADEIQSWSDDDLQSFLSGRRTLSVRAGSGHPRSVRRKKVRTAQDDLSADEVKRELSVMATREAGLAYLDQLALNREGLRRLASALDLPATKADTVERLRNRIVEGLIGYRLGSIAVRGTDSLPRAPK